MMNDLRVADLIAHLQTLDPALVVSIMDWEYSTGRLLQLDQIRVFKAGIYEGDTWQFLPDNYYDNAGAGKYAVKEPGILSLG
jgi:hypothetical protein